MPGVKITGWLAALSLAAASPSAFAQRAPKGPVNAVVNAPMAAQCDGVQIFTIEMSSRDAEKYCLYAIAERSKIDRYWGPAWQAPIRIHVDRNYRISRALVPAHFGNRGFLEMPMRRYMANDGALLHEMVHIYAPGANRFLAEGLAVYLHSKLAGNAAFPDFGRPLHDLARGELKELTSLSSLDSVRTPTPLDSVMEERRAYILSGSFVGFLIETRGLEQFKSFYEHGDYNRAYGLDLAALEARWRSSISQPITKRD